MMLSEAEYARQEQSRGVRIHQHAGVWWKRVFPCYCKPVFEFRTFAPRSARPSLFRSVAGYSHQVPDPAQGNRVVEYMILEGQALQSFDLSRLDGKKRNQVRKGLKTCRIERIQDIRPYREDLIQINITQSLRQMQSGVFYVPVTHYTEGESGWWREMLSLFGLPGREWWGAFVGDRLVSYLCTDAVETVMFVRAVKTHTDYFGHCPSDALHYTVLDLAARGGEVERVVHGGGDGTASLIRYKEQFLFRLKPFPWYSARETVYRAAVRLYHVKEWLRMRLQRRGLKTARGVPSGSVSATGLAPVGEADTASSSTPRVG